MIADTEPDITPFAPGIPPGTPGDDVIYGTDGADVINALQGDDFVDGLGGGDFIRGGAGDDSLYGGGGDDFMTGGSGADLMYGGSGADYMSGGGGNDVVIGGSGADWLQGGGGDDRILGGSGDDFIQGQAGDDAISGGQGSDTLSGGAGADQFHWIAADFTNPKGSSDLVLDFNRLEGDNIHFTGFVTSAALTAALASPGTEAVFSNAPGVDGITISYGNDPQTLVLAPNHHAGLSNDPRQLDTHIVFTNHDGATADIWFWDTQLQGSDFLLASG